MYEHKIKIPPGQWERKRVREEESEREMIILVLKWLLKITATGIILQNDGTIIICFN